LLPASTKNIPGSVFFLFRGLEMVFGRRNCVIRFHNVCRSGVRRNTAAAPLGPLARIKREKVPEDS
jgi:hypothetical protein